MKIPKPLLLLGLASLFNDIASEAIYPLLPIYFTEVLGASVMFIGVVEGSAETISALMKLVSGYFADRGYGTKPLVLAGYTVSSFLRPLIGIITSPWQAFLLRFGDRIGKGIRSAPRDAWLSHTVSEEHRAWMFSVHRAFDHTGAAVGPLLASLFLFFLPGNYRILFLLTIIPGLILLLLVYLAPDPDRSASPVTERASLKDLISVSLAMPKSFHLYMLALFFFTLGQSSEMFLLLKLREVGVSVALIPLLWTLLHIVKLSTAVWGGKFADHFGRGLSLSVGWVIFLGTYLAIGFSSNTNLVIAFFLCYGLCFAFIEGPSKAIVVNLVPEKRGTAFGAYNLVQAMAALPAGALGGFFWWKFSSKATFIFSALCVLIALLLFLISQSSAFRARSRSTNGG